MSPEATRKTTCLRAARRRGGDHAWPAYTYHPIHHGRNTRLGWCELCERVQCIHDGGWDWVIVFGCGDIRQRQPCMGNSKQADSPARKRVKENIPVHLAGMSILFFHVTSHIGRACFSHLLFLNHANAIANLVTHLCDLVLQLHERV